MESVVPFAGREGELDILGLSLDAAAEGRGSLLLIGGPAGISKTRLLAEAAKLAKGRGFAAGTGAALIETPHRFGAWVTGRIA